MAKQPKKLYVILLIALLARSVILWASWDQLTELKKDEKDYFRLAEGLLEGHGFAQSSIDGYVPTSTRPPLYPFFLAFFYRLGGVVLPIVVQVILSVGLIAAVYFLAARLRSEKVGLLTALIIAIDPATVAGCHYHLAEILYSVLLFTATAVLIWARKKETSYPYLVAGAAMGLATLCRPNTLYIWFWLLPWLLFSLRTSCGISRFVLYGGGFWLVTGLWYLRNYLVFGCLFFTSISSWNLYTYRAAWVHARAEDRPYSQVADEFRTDIHEETRNTKNPIQLQIRLCTQNSRKIFQRYPLHTAAMVLDGTVRVLLSPSRPLIADLLKLPQGGTGLLGLDGSLVERILKAAERTTFTDVVLILPDLFVFGLLYGGILLLLGFGIAQRRIPFPSGLVLWLALYLVLTSAGPEAYARFRIPLMPFLAWCSAEGWILLWNGLKHRLQLQEHTE